MHWFPLLKSTAHHQTASSSLATHSPVTPGSLFGLKSEKTSKLEAKPAATSKLEVKTTASGLVEPVEPSVALVSSSVFHAPQVHHSLPDRIISFGNALSGHPLQPLGSEIRKTSKLEATPTASALVELDEPLPLPWLPSLHFMLLKSTLPCQITTFPLATHSPVTPSRHLGLRFEKRQNWKPNLLRQPFLSFVSLPVGSVSYTHLRAHET